MMDHIPLAADFCWACTRYHGEVNGLCDSEDFDWEDASHRFKICSFCHMSRFCSKRCHEHAWKAGHYKYLCKLNHALLSKSLRQQLRYKRAQWGPQRSRHVSMLSAIHCCRGLPFKFVLVPESIPCKHRGLPSSGVEARSLAEVCASLGCIGSCGTPLDAGNKSM